MLHPQIRKFLSNIGKKGGKSYASTHSMADLGRKGGLQKGLNYRRKAELEGKLCEKCWKIPRGALRICDGCQGKFCKNCKALNKKKETFCKNCVV